MAWHLKLMGPSDYTIGLITLPRVGITYARPVGETVSRVVS